MPPTFPPLTSKGWKPSHRVTRCLCQSWWSWWRCWRWSWWSCFIMVKMIILIKMIVMTMILVVMRILKICSQFEIKWWDENVVNVVTDVWVSGLWSTLQGLSFTTPSPTKTTEHQNGFSKHQHVFFPFFGIKTKQHSLTWPRLQKINFHFPSPLLPKTGQTFLY